MMTWEKVIERIESYRKLEHDYDGEGSDPPSEKTIVNALAVVEKARTRFADPHCIPTVNSAIVISSVWANKLPWWEIEIDNDHIDWMEVDADENVKYFDFNPETMTLEELVEKDGE